MSIEKQPYLPGFEDPKSKNESQAESPEPKLEKPNLEPISNQIENIPNMKLFKNGKVIAQFIGLRPQAMFEKELENYL